VGDIIKEKTMLERYSEYMARGVPGDLAIDYAYANSQGSRSKKKQRISRRVKRIYEYNFPYFITFTIDPKHEEIPQQLIEKNIRQTLSQSALYIANVDYGSLNGRLHYHAFAAYHSKLNYNIFAAAYKYGNMHIQAVYNQNPTAITKYLFKLVNHSIKGSAQRIIYSREKKRS